MAHAKFLAQITMGIDELCMDGDKIREIDGDMCEGVLTLDIIARHFCFDWDNISEPLGERDFEKTEG